MKVNDETRAILARELPWITPLMDSRLQEFKVELLDLNTLSLHVDHDWQFGGNFDKIVLIDSNGHVIGRAGIKMEPVVRIRLIFRWPFYVKYKGTDMTYFQETLEEAVKRLAPASADTRYVVWIHRIFKMTIFKVPKSVPNLRAWILRKTEDEARQLRDVLDEVPADPAA